MKASFEHVARSEGCSLRVYHRRLQRIPFEWHHHPEYELTLTLNSAGRRYIGDAIDDYGDEDLVLVPPDLPHSWSSSHSLRAQEEQVAIVVWFDGQWARQLAACCPEYAPLLHLLQRASRGLAFAPPAAALVRAQLDGLLSAQPRLRLVTVLELLCLLAAMPAQPLASALPLADAVQPAGPQAERLQRVLALVATGFDQPLSIEQMAAAAHLSARSLQRFFLQHLGVSPSRYLARVRIAHACRLLVETGWPVALVAARAGYANVAHFNRQFRGEKNMTPAGFRKAFRLSPQSPQPLPSPDAAASAVALAQRPHSLRGS